MKGTVFGFLMMVFVFGSVFVAATEEHVVVKGSDGKYGIERHYG